MYFNAASGHVTNPVHILHVGANWGQEAEEYINAWPRTLKSITFIECIPALYKRLTEHVKQFQGRNGVQIYTIQALASDTHGEEVTFHIASNEGGSSSMFPPNPSVWAWDWVKFPATLSLSTTTLNLMKEGNELPTPYDTLVLDVQGAELKVLQGATNLLPAVNQLVCEYSVKPFYRGGALLSELTPFLTKEGFHIHMIPNTEQHPHGDMVWKRISPNP